MPEDFEEFQPVTIQLAKGPKRPMVFTVGGLTRVREHPDANSVDGTKRIDLLAFMIHEGLSTTDDSLTVQQVADMLDIRRIAYYDRKIGEAMGASNAPVKNAEPVAAESSQPATDASTSSESGPSEDTTSASVETLRESSPAAAASGT